jgi:hypothetical protein
LRDLAFNIPGVAITLTGKYGLQAQSLRFHGTATLDARLCQTMIGFKSTLLKALDPLFKKKHRRQALLFRSRSPGRGTSHRSDWMSFTKVPGSPWKLSPSGFRHRRAPGPQPRG